MLRILIFSGAFLGPALGAWPARAGEPGSCTDLSTTEETPLLPAADCKLSVLASDNVLLPGENSQVSVLAYFPATGYAFASSVFDVFADVPGWTFVSNGVVAGADVLGAEGGQDHQPFNGDFAGSSNPLRIWTSIFTPDSHDPRLVQIEASPNDFWYYPSQLTGTAVECAADPGREWLLVNPLSVGKVLIAPGEGTTVEIGGRGRDVLVGGLGADRILVGMLLPAVQKVGVNPDTPPSDLAIEVELEDRDEGDPLDGLAINFTGLEYAPTYDLWPDWAEADVYEYLIHVRETAQGVANISSFAGQTVRIRIRVGTDALEPLNLDRLPDAFSTTVELDRETSQTRVISMFDFEKPVQVVAPDGTILAAHTVEVHSIQNNLKQLSIGLHVVEATHTGGILIGLGDGSVRTISPGISR